MKFIPALALTPLILLVAASTPAAGGIITYNIAFSGSQSVPPNGSAGTGTASVTVNDILNTVSVSLTYSGLTAGATAAHIHCCVAITSAGPVVIPFTGFPNTVAGTYSNTFTGISAANIAGIENGLAYINIHNPVFPGGEIRANIVTPEPASLGLMGLGLLALLGARARRNRRFAS